MAVQPVIQTNRTNDMKATRVVRAGEHADEHVEGVLPLLGCATDLRSGADGGERGEHQAEIGRAPQRRSRSSAPCPSRSGPYRSRA